MERFITIAAACSALALTACGHYSQGGRHTGDATPPSSQGRGSGPTGMMGQMGSMGQMGPMHEQMHGRMHEQMPGPGGPVPMRGLGPLNPMGGMQQGTMGQLGMVGQMAGLGTLDLSAEQRSRIDEIRNETRQRGLEILRAAQTPGEPSAAQAAPLDEPAERGAYDAMAVAHRQVFELHLQARNRILEVLTPEQRERLGRPRRGE